MSRKPFDYPRPGYFSELVLLHDWPPGFVSHAPTKSESARQLAGQKSRATQIANGVTGSIAGLSKKGDAQIRASAESARARVKGARA